MIEMRALINPKFYFLSNGHKYGTFLSSYVKPKRAICISAPVQATEAISWTRQSEKDIAKHSSLHWSVERFLSAGLLAVFPASYFMVHPALDYLLATSVVLHSHWGMEVVMGDYVDRWDRYNRYSFYGPAAYAFTLMLSAAMLGSLCYFNYTDVGIREAIRLMWHEI